MAAAVLALAGSWIAYSTLSDSEDTDTQSERATAARELSRELARGARRDADKRLGIRFTRPRAWKRDRRQAVLTLTSPDRSIAVAIVAVSKRPRQALNDLEAQLRHTYAPVRGSGHVIGKLGTRPALVAELIGRSRRGQALRILALAARLPGRTYAVTVFSPLRPDVRRLAEARLILRSVRRR